MVGTSGEEVWYRSLIFHWGSAPGMEDGVHLCALSRTKDMLNELKPWLWPWVAVMLIACGEEPTERHGLAAAVLVSDTATDTITVRIWPRRLLTRMSSESRGGGGIESGSCATGRGGGSSRTATDSLGR